jgi:hypothetical protein
LQRLPRSNIERTQVGGKVLLEEHPGTADLGPWNSPCFGPLAQLFGVEAEEGRRFLEVEGTHTAVPQALRAPMAGDFPGRGGGRQRRREQVESASRAPQGTSQLGALRGA